VEIGRPPFERVQINYEGKMLDGYFRKPNNPKAKKFPVVNRVSRRGHHAEATIMVVEHTRPEAWRIWQWIPGQGGALL